MRHFLDLHIHSKYARACSPALTLPNIDAWCRIKGISVVATGDFTHPAWFRELEKNLEPAEGSLGLYHLRDEHLPMVMSLRATAGSEAISSLSSRKTLFLFGTEVACIYSHGGRVRRVHHLIFAPTLEVAREINTRLAARGAKLGSDGRPIIGISSKDLLQLLLEVDPRCVLIPAHAWTPWFAVFGSFSGYDRLEECFEELTPHIFAIETGLSSDPPMNWRVSGLDHIVLTSHSDAHSLPNLGREADVLEGDSPLSYDSIMNAIRSTATHPASLSSHPPYLVIPSEVEVSRNHQLIGTVEFIPDEGRYHYDGHRACGVRLHPKETDRYGGKCPKCNRAVTVGVLSRVEKLADRAAPQKPDGAPGFWGVVELDKIIADSLGVKSRRSKQVEKIFWDLLRAAPELTILIDYPIEEIREIASPVVAEAIDRMRRGKIKIDPGYDGEYGTIHLFQDHERNDKKQAILL